MWEAQNNRDRKMWNRCYIPGSSKLSLDDMLKYYDNT